MDDAYFSPLTQKEWDLARVGLHSLPGGVRLFTWSILAVIN
jgi:hypothetical protein